MCKFCQIAHKFAFEKRCLCVGHGLSNKRFPKPLSVTKNSVGLRTSVANNVDHNSSAHFTCSGRSRTDAVICNWKGLYSHVTLKDLQLSFQVQNKRTTFRSFTSICFCVKITGFLSQHFFLEISFLGKRNQYDVSLWSVRPAFVTKNVTKP